MPLLFYQSHICAQNIIDNTDTGPPSLRRVVLEKAFWTFPVELHPRE